MGDRANIVVKCNEEQVCLYTHWEGSNLPDTLQAALQKGVSRWQDFQYLNRIIFCTMLREASAGSTTGYGISEVPHDGENRVITVDVDSQTVVVGQNKPMTFEEFATHGSSW